MSKLWNRKVSIYAELGWLLVVAAAISALLFWGLNRAAGGWIDRFAWDDDYLAVENGKRLDRLQAYVTAHSIASSDTEKLTAWVRSQAVVSVRIYRNGFLCYDSNYAGEDFGGGGGYPFWEEGLRTVAFSDGTAQVSLYGYYAYQFQNWALIGELVLVFLLFLGIVMAGIRRTIRYIRTLGEEVRILEGGGLEHPITISGHDELTELAQGLDAMRRTFLTQNEQERHLAQASQRLVAEMSHDLRTPLTSIMLYTEILLSRKYRDEGQLMEYVEKIDKKARRLKQLSDHLLAYALVAGEEPAELEGPAPFQTVFYDTLSETAAYLEQQGFTVEMDFIWGEENILFNRDYIARIFDNLASNIVKYAGREMPVRIASVRSSGRIGFSVRNRKATPEVPQESNKIGLRSIQGMMEKMGGQCRVEESEAEFCLTLLFAGSA